VLTGTIATVVTASVQWQPTVSAATLGSQTVEVCDCNSAIVSTVARTTNHDSENYGDTTVLQSRPSVQSPVLRQPMCATPSHHHCSAAASGSSSATVAKATTVTSHSHQPQSPSTVTNHIHQPHSPTTFTNHIHQPQSPTTFTNHIHQPHSPTTFTNHSHQPHSPTTFTNHIHQPPPNRRCNGPSTHCYVCSPPHRIG
jgi:hypothetical protein